MHEPGGLGSAALYQWSPRIHINTAQNEPWIMLSKEPYRSLTSHMTATPFTQTDPDRHTNHSNGSWPPHHSLKRSLTATSFTQTEADGRSSECTRSSRAMYARSQCLSPPTWDIDLAFDGILIFFFYHALRINYFSLWAVTPETDAVN